MSRLFVPSCWNDEAGVCQTCAPLPEPEIFALPDIPIVFAEAPVFILPSSRRSRSRNQSRSSSFESEPEPAAWAQPEPVASGRARA